MPSRRLFAIGLALGLALVPAAVGADGGALQQSITAYQPANGDAQSFWRYFFFRKDGIDRETARADLSECAGYAHDPVLWAKIPDRMPLQGGVTGPDGSEGGFGLAGVAIFALVDDGLTRRITLANLRRCMGFKGYQRYGLSAKLWKQLNQGPPEEVLVRLAGLATAGKPAQPSLTP